MNNDDLRFDEFLSSGSDKDGSAKNSAQSGEQWDFSMFQTGAAKPAQSAGDEFKIDEFAGSGTTEETTVSDMQDAASPSEVPSVSDGEGDLDDSNLSEDFVIGKDFFIDSTEADGLTVTEQKPTQKKKKKRKKASAGKSCLLAVIWMALIFVISISAAGSILFFGMDYLGVGFDNDATVEIEIVVEEGTSAKEIAEMLEEAGIIQSPLFFRFYARQSGHDVQFQHGIYYFTKQDSYEDIAEALSKQGVIATSAKVTIPEGLNIDEIAQILEENKICTVDQFLAAVNEADASKYNVSFINELKSQTSGVHYILEGFLFPDTYELYCTNDKSGAEQAIKKMLQNMDNKFTAEMRARATELGYSMNDILTLASIIEMESSVASYEDKQKVSAVFHNRLNSDDYPMLQSDPTSEYPYNPELYDTYKAEGLAPGAYCSPGLDSIKAALYPDEECTAYYFVTDKDMNFYFNDTITEHNNTILKLKRAGLWV